MLVYMTDACMEVYVFAFIQSISEDVHTHVDSLVHSFGFMAFMSCHVHYTWHANLFGISAYMYAQCISCHEPCNPCNAHPQVVEAIAMATGGEQQQQQQPEELQQQQQQQQQQEEQQQEEQQREEQ